METIKIKIRQWGDSIGIVIPQSITKELNLKKNQEINVIFLPEKNLFEDLWEMGKRLNVKFDSQQIKDDIRKEWS